MSSVRRILVANRGEIVSRVARTARRMGIEVVAVYASSDRNSAYVQDADFSLPLGDDSSSSPYLDIDLLVAKAVANNCDAIHPGYGFLAENAAFARAVIDAGLTWIGPPPEAIEAMGGKIEAKRIAAQAGVPVLESIELSDDVDEAAEAAQRLLTPPLLVKPSAGGGGKGMHRVNDFDGFTDVLHRAQREAKAAFGDGTLFIERYLESARHVEVQVMADQHGNVLHLGTRDCSVQRRHQKVVEEAPAPGLSADLIDRMCAAATSLASEINYVGAGTVEYLVFGDEFIFLEMNTRLQVEHPVTEEITGRDLVELQVIAARGDALPLTQGEITTSGHSIEVRLYAENPAKRFLPSPGTVDVCELPDTEGIRWEMGIQTGSVVSSRYDPMVGKVVATGRDRNEARHRLAHALKRLRLAGLRTNIELLVAILEDEDFADVVLSTHFLDLHPDLVKPQTRPEDTQRNIIAGLVHEALNRREQTKVQPFMPVGWRSLRSQGTRVVVHVGDENFTVEYVQERDGSWTFQIADQSFEVNVISFSADSIDLEIDDLRGSFDIRPQADRIYVFGQWGVTGFEEIPALGGDAGHVAGDLVSPLPGVVVRVVASVGDKVLAGDTIVTIEAMKMEHQISAPSDGVLQTISVNEGDVVDHGQSIGIIEPAEA